MNKLIVGAALAALAVVPSQLDARLPKMPRDKWPAGVVICPECDGDGWVRCGFLYFDSKDCRTCDGRGYLPPPPPPEPKKPEVRPPEPKPAPHVGPRPPEPKPAPHVGPHPSPAKPDVRKPVVETPKNPDAHGPAPKQGGHGEPDRHDKGPQGGPGNQPRQPGR